MPTIKVINIIKITFLLIIFINSNITADNNKHSSAIYICPMHNHIQKDHSGHCPICGMELVLDKDATEKLSSIKLSKEIKETINVLTENVRELEIQKEIYSGIRLSHVEQPTTLLDIELTKPSLKWLKQGGLVEVEAKDHLWGIHTWQGEILNIADTPNPKTHAYTTRIKLQTPYNILKPNMHITLSFYGDSTSALVIPFKAVLFDTEGNRHAVKVVGKNQYQIIDIETGIRQDHLIQVTQGLDKGDKIVTSGQFLLNAEKQLMEGVSHD